MLRFVFPVQASAMAVLPSEKTAYQGHFERPIDCFFRFLQLLKQVRVNINPRALTHFEKGPDLLKNLLLCLENIQRLLAIEAVFVHTQTGPLAAWEARLRCNYFAHYQNFAVRRAFANRTSAFLLVLCSILALASLSWYKIQNKKYE